MGLTLCWLSLGVCFVERTVLDSGCLIGLCDGDPFPLQGIPGVEHTCLALWMRVWITDCFAEMKWGG